MTSLKKKLGLLMAGTLAVIGLIGNTEKIEAATDFLYFLLIQ